MAKRCSPKVAIISMIVMNSVMLILELAFGFVTNSVTLVADAFHMISDVLALVVALASMNISTKSRSPRNTFGWVRAEVIGALINGVFLLAMCLSISLDSLYRLVFPERVNHAVMMLVVGVAGLIVNVIGVILFHGHARGADEEENKEVLEPSRIQESFQGRVFDTALTDDGMDEDKEKNSSISRDKEMSTESRKKSSNLNMKAAFLHVVGDALGSVIVIVSASASCIWPHVDVLNTYLDPVLSLLMVVIMVFTTIPLVREAALILLQTTPNFVDYHELEKRLLGVDGIKAVHEFHIWRLVGDKVIATLHAQFESSEDYISSIDGIQNMFHEAGIHNVTLQPEFSQEADCVMACEPTKCSQDKLQCCYEVKPPAVNVNILTQKRS